MKTVDIYTDGACSGNPGPGGYGIVMLYKNNRKEMQGCYRLTTNNRMEIIAAILALEALREPCIVRLYSDSRYLVDAIEKGWVARWQKNNWMRNKSDEAVNVDLWKRLLNQLERHKVEFIWVRGHASNVENNRCDELARGAIHEGGFLVDEGYEG
jgi:ribonuclease HI